MAEFPLTLPLSLAQRRLWYMAQLYPGNPYYNVTLAMRLQMEIRPEAMAKALKRLVERHEILRTHYPIKDGTPVQEIHSVDGWQMAFSDAATSRGTRAEIFDRFIKKKARTRLRLEQGPVFDAHLLTLAPDDHVLVMVMHHISVDQWSINILTRDLEALYDAISTGTKENLPQPAQYRDFVVWEMEQLRRRERELIAYWDCQLKDAPAPLPLPYDRARPEKSRQLGGEWRFQISQSDTEQLKSLTRQHGASLFMGALTIWAILLHKATTREDMFIGTTSAFRENSKFNHTVGCFINTLAIRIRLTPNETFVAVLERVRDQVLDCFKHHSFSYERLIERLRVSAPHAGGELVNAYLQFQPGSLSMPRNAAKRLNPNVNVHNGRAKFELMLNMSLRNSGLDCVIEYNRELFSRSRIRALAADFSSILHDCISQPAQPVIDIKAQSESFRDGPPSVLKTQENKPSRAAAPKSIQEASSIQQDLLEIWRKLLLTEDISEDDDFQSRGGHSLLFAQLAWCLRRKFGVSIPLAELHVAQQFRSMVALISSARNKHVRSSVPPALRLEHIGGIPCQIDLGRWTWKALKQLISENKLFNTSPEKVMHVATALKGTPFQFESKCPLPVPGYMPVRLGTLDCVTFVITVLALASADTIEAFVQNLYRLRYRSSDGKLIDNDPEEGNIFDFVEESLLINGVASGFLRDVTTEVANDADLVRLSGQLKPFHRSELIDPLALRVTPKLGFNTISAEFLPRSDFRNLNPPTRLTSGDVLLMSKGVDEQGQLIHHLGIACVEARNSFLIQSTRHFAFSPTKSRRRSRYSGIFYDSEKTQEQIGVGMAGRFLGDAYSFELNGLPYHAYHAGTRRTLCDYLENNFSYVMILRPDFHG